MLKILKNKLFILLISTLFIVSCNQNGKSLFSSSSDKEAAVLIVNYYNLVLDYDSKATSNLNVLLDENLERLSEMVKNKRTNNKRIRWNNFVGIGPNVESFSNNTQVSILEPKTFLDEKSAEKMTPLMQKMTSSYTAIKEAFLDFKNYYDNNDYNNDDWAKGAELTKIMEDETLAYFETRERVFTILEPIVDKAEEDALSGHPLVTEITHVKRTLKSAEKAMVAIGNETVDMNVVTELSENIKARITEGKGMSKSNLESQNKEHEFKSFYEITIWFSEELEKVAKNKRVTKHEYGKLSANYNKMVNSYNRFIQ